MDLSKYDECNIWLCSLFVCYTSEVTMSQLGFLALDVLKLLPCQNPALCVLRAASTAAFPKGETAMNVFDRRAKALHRARSVQGDNHQVFDYLKEEVGYRVYDRVLDIKRHFDTVVDLSAGKGYIGRNFTKVG